MAYEPPQRTTPEPHRAGERLGFWHLAAAAAFGAALSVLVVVARDDAKRGTVATPPEPTTTSAEVAEPTASPTPEAPSSPPNTRLEATVRAPEVAPTETPPPSAPATADTTPAVASETEPTPSPAPSTVAENEATSAVSQPPREEIFAPVRPAPVLVGAGPFMTAPPPWAASAFVPNPNAGAGPFLTEAPFYTSSAMIPNPSAGAGPFLTEPGLAPPEPSELPNVGAEPTAEANPASEITFVPAPMPVFVPLGDIRGSGASIGLPSIATGGPSAPGSRLGASASPLQWNQGLTPSDPFRAPAFGAPGAFGAPAPAAFGVPSSIAPIAPMFGPATPSPLGWPARPW